MKAILRGVIRRLGYHVEGIRYTPRQLLDASRLRRLEFDDVICRRMVEHGPACSFVQIGAYDGVSTDPLHKYIGRFGWRGVMLEPQPGPAARLRELYEGNPGIAVIEAALDAQPGLRSLFTVESDELPRWAGGMASFERSHIEKHEHLIPGVSSKIRELEVQCVTFEEVLSHFPTGPLDLLQIDAEGADGYLLSLFPFDRLKPVIIHWEIKNLTRSQQEDALELVGRHGYLIARSGAEDMLAVARDEPAAG